MFSTPKLIAGIALAIGATIEVICIALAVILDKGDLITLGILPLILFLGFVPLLMLWDSKD